MNSGNDAFYDYYAAESAKQSTVERFAATRDAVMRAARHFGLRAGPLDVADIGCGAGTQCLLWAEAGHRVHGLDVNAPLVELGRERVRAAGLYADLRVGTAVELPWADGSMDVSLCPELLEHVVDWRTCLDEACRVLRPGGLLYLSTTNRLCPIQNEFDVPLYSWFPGRIKRRYERLARTTRRELVSHAEYPAVNWFSYYELRDDLRRRGFDCLDRFDVAAAGATSASARIVLGTVRALPPLRLLGQICTPYTVVFAAKRAR